MLPKSQGFSNFKLSALVCFSHSVENWTAITLASVLLLGRNGKRWRRERNGAGRTPHTRHTKNPPSHSRAFVVFNSTSHHVIKAFGDNWGYNVEKKFCLESITWSSLTASLSHCGAVRGSGGERSRWPVSRGGQERLRRHLPPPLRTTCRRGRCSPDVSTRWHFKYFNPPHPGYGGQMSLELHPPQKLNFLWFSIGLADYPAMLDD